MQNSWTGRLFNIHFFNALVSGILLFYSISVFCLLYFTPHTQPIWANSSLSHTHTLSACSYIVTNVNHRTLIYTRVPKSESVHLIKKKQKKTNKLFYTVYNYTLYIIYLHNYTHQKHFMHFNLAFLQKLFWKIIFYLKKSK